MFRANEAFPQGLDHTCSPKRSSVDIWRNDKGSNVLNVSREWLLLVYQYSQGNLTYSKDRLPALSGIARVFCKKYALDHVNPGTGSGQHYLTGLWCSNLEHQLFWQGITWPVAPRPDSPCRPTWSWVSVAGRVRAQIIPLIFNFRVLDARVVPTTEDEYGEVTSGSLRLKCHPLIPATLTSRQSLSIGRVATTYHEVGVELDEPISRHGVFALHGGETSDGIQVGTLLQPTGTGQTYRRVGCTELRRKPSSRNQNYPSSSHSKQQ